MRENKEQKQVRELMKTSGIIKINQKDPKIPIENQIGIFSQQEFDTCFSTWEKILRLAKNEFNISLIVDIPPNCIVVFLEKLIYTGAEIILYLETCAAIEILEDAINLAQNKKSTLFRDAINFVNQEHSGVNIVFCPYCGMNAYFFKRTRWPKWVCSTLSCDASVGIHMNRRGHIPLGTLANAELRERRQKTHYFMHLLIEKIKNETKLSTSDARTLAYKWLAFILDIDEKQCHIGLFDIKLCIRVRDIINNYINDFSIFNYVEKKRIYQFLSYGKPIKFSDLFQSVAQNFDVK